MVVKLPHISMTIGRGVRTAAQRAPEKIAIIFEDRQLRYGELSERMSRISNVARGHWQLTHGDRVVLLAPNCLEYAEVLFGLADLGIIVVTLNPKLTKHELIKIMSDCSPALIITHESIETELDFGIPIMRFGASYESLLQKASPNCEYPAIAESDCFVIGYTSGTTGEAKGVALSHRSRTFTLLAMAQEWGCFGIDDHFLQMTPLFHAAGFVFLAAPLWGGGTVTILPVFDPEETMRRLASGVHSGVFLVPTMFHRLLSLESPFLAAHRPNGLKAVISNASSLRQGLKEQIIEAWGEGLLHETYGATEYGIVTNIRPCDQLRKSNSVGTPFPLVEVILRDETGAAIEDQRVGEIFARGPGAFNGYWRKPAETNAAVRDGWITVGDMAWRDGEGFYHIVDRKKDMIVSGGVNIFPREIEDVLVGCTGVREVAVVGLADAEWGERVHAFIVAEDPTHPPSSVMLEDACRSRLASFKRPRGFTFVDELPRNASGKVLKRVLREHGAAPKGAF